MADHGVLTRFLSVTSPRHRRWRALLKSCDLAPTDVSSDNRPGPRDILVGGIPRSGTALLTALLHRPPASVAVMEPWDALRLPPDRLFSSLREELSAGVLQRGRLDLSAVAAGEVRWVSEGQHAYAVPYEDNTTVIVKFPTMWQYLDRLPSTRFIMCVRHPSPVLQSFARTSGRLAEGLDYDVEFNRAINHELLASTADVEIRRSMFYDRIARSIAEHRDRPNVLVVKYEDWWRRRAGLIEELEQFVGVSLHPLTIRLDEPRQPTLLDPRTWDYLGGARLLGYHQ